MTRSIPSRAHRVAATTVALATLLLIAVGITGATADSRTTDVAITPLVPVKSVTTGSYVAAGKTYAFVASGTTSTVPSNATVVQLAITVKGTQAGTLSFAPLGDPANSSPTTVSWAAGGTGAGTVKVNVGVSNKVVITNSSAASATVGVKITGYSTQVTAAGISGAGGTDGQVLTNDGHGSVSWQTPPTLLKAHVTGFGTVEVGDVTATRLATGRYVIDFHRPLAGCAFSANTGAYNGGGWNSIAVISFIAQAHQSTATVWINRGDNGTPVDSDFYLTGIC